MTLRKKFPTYRQLDQMDCGPTCIKILADHFQTGATWTNIRDWMDIQRNGHTTLIGLARGFEHHGMSVQWILCSPNALSRIGTTPLIVPWPDNHFLLIHRVGKSKIYLIDPARGRWAINRRHFEKYWAPNGAGIALSVTLKTSIVRKARSPWAGLFLALNIGLRP